MGRLRKVNKLGPFGMFQRLSHDWSADREERAEDDAPRYEQDHIAHKVKTFFHYYAINRESTLHSIRAHGILTMSRPQDDDLDALPPLVCFPTSRSLTNLLTLVATTTVCFADDARWRA